MPSHDPHRRKIVASIAANSRWAKVRDRAAATEAARRASNERFYQEVDPDGTLDPETRQKLAENARRAFYARLSLRAAQARSKRAQGGDE